MARFTLLSLFVVCLLCYVQAYPQGDVGATTPAPASNVADNMERMLASVMETMQKGIKDVMENPNVSKMVHDSQVAIQNAAENVRIQAAKMMPKTD